jgi:SagB-type dehydrogenase family enzyme
VVEQLRDAQILVVEGSPRAAREAAITRSWGEWGPIGRAFHYATRTDRGTPFLDATEHGASLRAALPQHPPPPATAERGTGGRLPLPRRDQASWHHRDLIDVLYRRRSSRLFGSEPVPLPAVGALLETTASIVALDEETQTVHKTSPSGGGRHPTELYLLVRNVAELPPGIYHYRSGDHELAYVNEPPSDSALVAACADQAWVLQSGLVVFFTSVLARTTWKYQRPRSYRVLNLDVGHLGQTLALTATALGLHSTFTAALRDELVEQQLGCDPATELVLGCAVIGSRSATS